MPEHRPRLPELVAIARESLAALSDPALPDGRFELRVVAHALEIVERELELAAAASGVELAALRDLVGHEGELEALNQELCQLLARGVIAADDPLFLQRMRGCVLARLAIDNPRFERAPQLTDANGEAND